MLTWVFQLFVMLLEAVVLVGQVFFSQQINRIPTRASMMPSLSVTASIELPSCTSCRLLFTTPASHGRYPPQPGDYQSPVGQRVKTTAFSIT